MNTQITKRQPQSLGSLIEKRNWRSIIPTLSDEKNKELAAYREKYGDYKIFEEKFSASKQASFAEHPEGCYLGNSPCLIDIKHLYGKTQMRLWLSEQLAYATGCLGKRFAGYECEKDARFGYKNPVLIEFIKSLCVNYPGILLSEWMLFFFRMRSGRYGKIYGDLTPDYVMDAMKIFLRERNGEVDMYLRRMQSNNREIKTDAVTYDEYLRMKDAGEIEEYKPEEISTDK